MNQKDFFDKYAPDAVAAMKATGIPASVTLAQACIESAYGQAAFGNAFFGIKAGKGWTGKVQLLRTTEDLRCSSVESLKMSSGIEFPSVISITPAQNNPGLYIWSVRDNFRAYDTVTECFIDHAEFFIKNGRYSKALLDKGNAIEFAADIEHAGYSTTPHYGDVIVAVMKEYDLMKYDVLPVAPEEKPVVQTEPTTVATPPAPAQQDTEPTILKMAEEVVDKANQQPKQ